ncbi:MAG: hypothetical protein BWX86_00642 [Verrucomicrobia bacterium ADurb.Bin122]|nr:MAG: hypothetical protein BWX86_00642 [Verrucomicrobia bacterium ADurb.Bin122]
MAFAGVVGPLAWARCSGVAVQCEENAASASRLRVSSSGTTFSTPMVRGSVPRRSLAERAPMVRPTSGYEAPRLKSAPRAVSVGSLVKTGTPAALAMEMMEPAEELTTVSPPIQTASTSRASTERKASGTSEVLPALASTSSMPSSEQMARALSTQASELCSVGFQTAPTRRSLGFICRAMRKIFVTGWKVPMPTRWAGCWSGAGPVMPTPEP